MTDRTLTLAFDVYGTLVDPAGMAMQLQADVGEAAPAFATAWREKQLEYAFRRGLMQLYATFAVCTADAFDHTAARFGVSLTPERRGEILEAYKRLPAFDEVAAALGTLRDAGHRLFAFSNGTEADVTAVLASAGLHPLLGGVVSVDDLRIFKPAPAVYAHVRRATGAWSGKVLAGFQQCVGRDRRSCGSLDAAWINRSAAQVYDPWGIEPTLVVRSLAELADQL